MRVLIVAVLAAALLGCGAAPVEPVSPSGDRHRSDTDTENLAEGDPPAREPVACGAQTCSPDQYCEVRCTCCGARVASPGEGSAEMSCQPIPAGCATGATVPNDAVCSQRTVHIPCA